MHDCVGRPKHVLPIERLFQETDEHHHVIDRVRGRCCQSWGSRTRNASLSIWSFLWKQVQLGPDRQVKPYDNPKLDQSIIARIDPELDEIRYGSSDPPQGKSVANVDHLRAHISNKFKVQVLEDNQATITITATGSSASMRHTDRTQRISFRCLKQHFEVGHFNMINVDTGEQAADIFFEACCGQA